MKELSEVERAAYAWAARLKCANEGSIEFDDKPCMSYAHEGEKGVYVQAWVWVGVDELKDS